MVGHLASPKPLHMARWGGKGALIGCTRRTTGPTGTLTLPAADQTLTHTHTTYQPNRTPNHGILSPPPQVMSHYRLGWAVRGLAHDRYIVAVAPSVRASSLPLPHPFKPWKSP